MALARLFAPRPTLSDAEVARGVRWWTLDGTAAMGFSSITTGGFLAAFALVLGANNLQIGLLAAIPALTQPLQIPAILLVDRLKRRKAIAVSAWLAAQSLWVPIALIPIFIGVPSGAAISILLGLIAVRSFLVALNNCAWNSWIRDLIPQGSMGRLFARRMTHANAVGMVIGLAAAFFVDHWRAQAGAEAEALGYTIALLAGALTLGLASPVFRVLMPEPLMQAPAGPQPALFKILATPLRDENYGRLLRFQFLWGLALNLATPFFAVYMLQRLDMSVTAVVAFGVLSKGANILFLRVWGPLSDQVGAKTVLSVASSLYLLVILGWTFTTMPERYFLTIPLLVLLHMLAGVASAGVSLTTGTIGMKLAPQGQATAYLAAAALAANLGAGIGPLIGGQFADFFSARNLTVTLGWSDPFRAVQLSAFNLTGFDFLFGIAFILGLLTLNLLSGLREEGEASREVVLDALLNPMREIARPMSSVPGLSFLHQFPYGNLTRAPVPGLDVALGVTAYQIADSARMACTAAAQGRRTTAGITQALEGSISSLFKAGATAGTYAMEVASQGTRGALHGLGGEAESMGELVRHGLLGVIRGLRRTKADPAATFAGVGFGAIQGAHETGGSLPEALTAAVQTARTAAREEGLPEARAVEQVIDGALRAAESIGPEAAADVRAAVSAEGETTDRATSGGPGDDPAWQPIQS